MTDFWIGFLGGTLTTCAVISGVLYRGYKRWERAGRAERDKTWASMRRAVREHEPEAHG